MTATVHFVNRQSDYQYFLSVFKLLLFFSWFNFSISYFYLSLVHVDYVNYHVVVFRAHLHLNELSLICDMWLNKITYLLTVWWSRGSHFVESGYLSLRFPNMVKVTIHDHWTRVTRFNPLWVSGFIISTPRKFSHRQVILPINSSAHWSDYFYDKKVQNIKPKIFDNLAIMRL